MKRKTSKRTVKRIPPVTAAPSGAVLSRIAGPVAVAKGLGAKMYDVVLVGKEELLGEVIQITGEKTVIQVYEDTSGLKPGEPVRDLGAPLSVELGPGILSAIYDGIQRPLDKLRVATGDFVKRGAQLPGLDRKRQWKFLASLKNGTVLQGGEILGHVEEMPGFRHAILVPPDVQGTLANLKSGTYTVQDVIGKVTNGTKSTPLYLMHKWPVRRARPVRSKLAPSTPLITGQRIIDTLFPLAKGGTAIIPGPFGAGKTVTQQALAKWSDADIIVYIGCGERGNEMTEVLTEFPKLKDPRTGAPLMNRTILIANTSNMPVAAREASIYTGVTIAEYFRDMGYDVALMADSTSRWAEALREISSRLEEMPGEEGFPAYLASRVAEFYERAGVVLPLAGRERPSSLSIIGAVSPPGGDFFEPVTQSSLRVAKVFWALDAKLAQQRHFPSVNWLESYSLYPHILGPWYTKNVDAQWGACVQAIMTILQQEAELLEIVQLVGADALPEDQQLTLHIARLIREGMLQQSAYDEREAFSSVQRSFHMMQLILLYKERASQEIQRTIPFAQIATLGLSEKIYSYKRAEEKAYEDIKHEIETKLPGGDA